MATAAQPSTSYINKASHIPIYAQLQEILRRDITEERLSPGDRLPSENELSARFHISRMTVRQALRELIREGLVRVRKGEGSFVSSDPDVQMLIKLDGFSTEMQKLGHRVHSQFLEATEIDSYKEFRLAFLGLHEKKGDSLVRIKRLRFLDNTPFAIETSYLSGRIGRDLLNRRFDRSFSIYRFLEQECRLDLAKAEHMIEPLLADAVTAKLLRIKPGRPVLSLSGTTYSSEGLPVEYLEGIYLGDKYKLKISIGR